jgi:hypothetical protein
MIYLRTELVAQILQLRMIWWWINTELERMWKEAIVGWFEVPSQRLSGGTEKTHEELNNDILYPGVDLKPWSLSRKECYPFDSDIRWPFTEHW